MKNTKKNTTGSSKVKAKIKQLANSKKSTKPQEGIKESTPLTPESNQKTSDDAVEHKPLDGTMKIDHLPFESQMKVIFNPLMGVDQKQVVKSENNKDPFAPSGFVVERKK